MSTIAEFINDADALAALNIPFFVWGIPGVGKSEAVAALAAKHGARLVDIRLSLFDPVDLRGLPSIVDGFTAWIRPQIWPRDENEKTWIFFDEMDRAPVQVGNAALQIVLDRKIGEHALPASTYVCAAGNGATDKRGTNPISGAHANRMTHLHIEADAETAARYWLDTGVHPAMAAFIRYRPALVATVAMGDEKAFASPRSWVRVARMLDLPDAQRMRLASGTVGSAPAAEFESFYRIWRELPPIDALIANPMGAPVPSSPSGLYAVSAALARKATIGNFGNVVTYLGRMPREFAIMAMRDATSRDSSLKETSAFIGWNLANKDVTF